MSTFDKVYIDKVDFDIAEFKPRMKGVLPTVNTKQMEMDVFKMLRDNYLMDPEDIRRAAPFVDILNAVIMIAMTEMAAPKLWSDPVSAK